MIEIFTPDQTDYRLYANLPISIFGILANILNILVFYDREMRTLLMNHFLMALSISGKKIIFSLKKLNFSRMYKLQKVKKILVTGQKYANFEHDNILFIVTNKTNLCVRRNLDSKNRLKPILSPGLSLSPQLSLSPSLSLSLSLNLSPSLCLSLSPNLCLSPETILSTMND
jgi:hypothetical protein